MTVVTDNPEVLMQDIGKWASSQVRAVASTLFTELHENTPRRTGWAATNWFPFQGGPESVFFGFSFPDHRSKSVDGSTFGRGISFIWTEWRPGTPLSICNSVPYVGRLEDGWSPQGSGFINSAIARAQNTPPREDYEGDPGGIFV